MDLNAQSFDKICRVCLIQSAELKSLFTKVEGEYRNLIEVLIFITNVDIKIEDNLPKQVCATCETNMRNADAFKRRCLESDTILNTINSNTDESSIIKAEKSDLKQKLSEYGTYVSRIPVINDSKSAIEMKDIEIHDFTQSTTSYTKNTNSEVIKEEQEDDKFNDDNDITHFDDAGEIEIPIDNLDDKSNIKKIKEETKKLPIKYQCYCEEIFTSKVEYKAHLKGKLCNTFKIVKIGGNSRVIKVPLHCQKCNKKFPTLRAYKTHQQNHHKEDTDNIELHQCSYCLRKFKHKVSLEAHIQKHEESFNIRYVCEICKREFKYKAYLDNHLLTAHVRSDGYTCDVCTQSFVSKETLEAHKKSHENEKKHRCTECNKAFYMLCTLKEHMRTHTGEKPFLCSQCGKGFSQKTNLGQHMRRHQGLKPFKCETCEKKFVSKGELDAHTRKHSGAHPFMCDDCGNGFTTSSALVKHRRTHTGERPYHCDLCPMSFAASGTLKNHRRTHTGERPFQCSYCEKAFVQRNDLISHIRCHTGERPYICNQCGQSFRKASGLKAHVKMHIKDPVVGVNAMLTSMHCTEG